MANLALAFPFLLLALAGVAIYVQVTSSTLFLPISAGTTVLAIILPFLAAANIFYTPFLQRMLQRRVTSSPAFLQLLPIAPQVIQGILTVIVATLAAQGFGSGRIVDCGLEGNWQQLWSEHDGRRIQRIQDAFNCCGLRSVKDRDWPPKECRNLYSNRHDSCLSPWRASMQRSAGLEFGVALAVGILQMVHLVLFRLRNSGGSSTRVPYRRIPHSVGTNTREGLLENGTAGEGEGNGANGEDVNGDGHRDYGTLGDGPNHRLEPSGLGDEGSNWR